MHSAWKRHQDAAFWVDINLANRGLTFYQTRSNAIILQGTLPAYCIPQVVRLKTGEDLYDKSYLSPRPQPKISLRHDHDWTRGNDQWGSTVEQHSFNSLLEKFNALHSKPTQSKPSPICDRSEKPEDTERVFVEKETSRSHEIDDQRLQEELGSSDRTGKPVKVSEDIRVMHVHDGTGEPVKSSASTQWKNLFLPNIVTQNIDFNIPGVSNSMVKRSHGVNVHNLIQKIESYPQRQALQSDLQQHRAFNPHKMRSKLLETLNYARWSTWSQKHNAEHA